MKKCELCNKEHDGSYGSGRFCSKECARSFSTKRDNTKENKTAKCVICGKEVEVNKRSDSSKIKCKECKKKEKKKKCRICGSNFGNCLRPEICKKHQIFPALIDLFGFKKEKIGNIEVYEEYERVKNLLIEDYWENNLSIIEMMKKYNYPLNSGNFIKKMKTLEISRRSVSEGIKVAIMENRINTPKGKNQYHHAWHTTWNNKQVYYRSSYELDYCIELDNKQIDYEMESLRILYWDSQLLMQRVAIPDFYIPSENKIVEIKSTYTYDEINMRDKIKAYKQHGYKIDVILNHILVINETF
jgi:hypothetical protein